MESTVGSPLQGVRTSNQSTINHNHDCKLQFVIISDASPTAPAHKSPIAPMVGVNVISIIFKK